MKSDFIFSGTMNETLLSIWTQVRDLVNIIFVVILLIAALYNVLGLGESGGLEYFQLKKALPKLVLGLVIVNFSYVGVRLMVDVVNVGTAITFAIPLSTPIPEKVRKEILENGSLDTLCSLSSGIESAADKAMSNDPTAKAAAAKAAAEKAKAEKGKKPAPGANAPAEPSTGGMPGLTKICESKGKMSEEVKQFMSEWSVDGALPIMAIKFMNLQKLDKVATTLQENGKTLSSLAINMIVSIIMYFIFGATFISLFFVLLGRAVALWLVVVLSPVFALQLTFPQVLAQVSSSGGDFAGKIVKTLIAPMIIGFVLSIGFMILGTIQQVDYSGTDLASLSFNLDSINFSASNVDTFQSLLIAIGTVAFIWTGINGAVSGAIGGEVAGTMLSALKGAGEWLAKAPLTYGRIFQVKSPDGHSSHGVSGGALLKVVSSIPEGMEAKERQEANNLIKQWGMTGSKTEEMKNLKSTKEGFDNLKQLDIMTRKDLFNSGEFDNVLEKWMKDRTTGMTGQTRIEVNKLLESLKGKSGEEREKLWKEAEQKGWFKELASDDKMTQMNELQSLIASANEADKKLLGNIKTAVDKGEKLNEYLAKHTAEKAAYERAKGSPAPAAPSAAPAPAAAPTQARPPAPAPTGPAPQPAPAAAPPVAPPQPPAHP